MMGSAFDVESYIESQLSKVGKTSTGQLIAECPWCQRHGGFYINADTGHYICHKCGERGRYLVGLVAHLEGMSWQEARKYILRNSVKFRRKETTQTLLEKIRKFRPGDTTIVNGERVDVPLPEEFIPVYSKKKWRYPVYLKERGFKRKTARKFGMGYCLSGRYYGRVVIPIRCPYGNSFTARDTTGESELKYLNPKQANHSHLLLGWDVIKPNQDLALVEGPLDAVKLYQNGIQALALSGKVLHPRQLEMLIKCPTHIGITVMLDPDAQADAYSVAAQLVCHFKNVYVATLPDGVDPGDTTPELAREVYENSKRFDGDRTPGLLARLKKSREKLSQNYG